MAVIRFQSNWLSNVADVQIHVWNINILDTGKAKARKTFDTVIKRQSMVLGKV